LKFDKKGFNKGGLPDVEKIEMRKAIERGQKDIAERLEMIAKDVAFTQLGIDKEASLEELLEELDNNHIQINVNVARVDGKFYATFTVSIIMDAIEL
jgi:hypothetical protein